MPLMSRNAQAVLEGFKKLQPDEQYAVYETIARMVVPGDYGPLSDEDLTGIAAQTFSLLDEEESRGQPG
jgi:hypothetical protein